MKHLGKLAIVLVFLSSCEREARITIPPQTPKLVAESLQGQNEFPAARISHTHGVTDPIPTGGQNDAYIVNNATALLYEDDVLKDSLKFNAGNRRYRAANAKIQAGKTYKLVLSAPGYPSAEAISFTPALVPINSMTFTPNARFDSNGDPQDELKITFTDNGATEDYYLIRILDASGNHLFCVNTNDRDVEKLVFEDPFYADDCLQSDRLLLSDLNFNGTTKTLRFYAEAGQLNQQNTPGGIRRSTAQLLHINKDYYKYIKSVNSYENATDNPFAEPVNLYTNMKNGYGLFTTYGIVVDSIR